MRGIVWSKKTILIVAATAGAVAVLCILFAVPWKTVPYQVLENYQDIEVVWEPCELPGAKTPIGVMEREEVVYEGGVYSTPWGLTVPFSVTSTGARLVGSFKLPAPGGLYLYTATGRIVYEQLGTEGEVDIPLPLGEYRVLLREGVFWGGNMRLSLRLKWTDPGEVAAVISGYCGKPVVVEKQRTVTNYRKASLWQIIFSGR